MGPSVPGAPDVWVGMVLGVTAFEKLTIEMEICTHNSTSVPGRTVFKMVYLNWDGAHTQKSLCIFFPVGGVCRPSDFLPTTGVLQSTC